MSLKINSKIEKKLIEENIKIVNLGLNRDIFIFNKIGRIRKIIKENNIDLINTWLYKTDFLIGVICLIIGFKM